MKKLLTLFVILPTLSFANPQKVRTEPVAQPNYKQAIHRTYTVNGQSFVATVDVSGNLILTPYSEPQSNESFIIKPILIIKK